MLELDVSSSIERRREHSGSCIWHPVLSFCAAKGPDAKRSGRC